MPLTTMRLVVLVLVALWVSLGISRFETAYSPKCLEEFLGSSANRRRAGDLPSDPGLAKVGAPKGLPEFLSVEHYETLRRTSISAPTPEAMSVRLAAKVTSGTSGAPPVLGSGVAGGVAVGAAGGGGGGGGGGRGGGGGLRK